MRKLYTHRVQTCLLNELLSSFVTFSVFDKVFVRVSTKYHKNLKEKIELISTSLWLHAHEQWQSNNNNDSNGSNANREIGEENRRWLKLMRIDLKISSNKTKKCVLNNSGIKRSQISVSCRWWRRRRRRLLLSPICKQIQVASARARAHTHKKIV